MTMALIVGGASAPPRRLVAPWARRAALVVAADGGAATARRLGLRPDWVVGDLDSLLPIDRRRLGERVVEDADPDRTDLQKCIAFARGKGATEIVIVAATTGRLDHTLGALAAALDASAALPVRVIDPLFDIQVVRGEASFRAPKGTMLSLLAPSGARGVTFTGVRYPLDSVELPFSPLGIHNEALGGPVALTVREGAVLLMRAHRGVAAPRPGPLRSRGRRRSGRS